MATPTPQNRVPMTPEQLTALRLQQEMDVRNRPFTDAELDDMLPGPNQGFDILAPPDNYQPITTPARRLAATPTPIAGGMYQIPEEQRGLASEVPRLADEDLPLSKPEDIQHFGKLLDGKKEEEMAPEEAKERRIMMLLLKVKNGTPPQRKSALRQLTENARRFGAGALFNQILPLLMSPTLEDQVRATRLCYLCALLIAYARSLP